LPPSATFPDGFCTLSGTSDDDCPGTAHCIENEGGVCMFGCRIEEGCGFLGDGWMCKPEPLESDGSQVMVCIGE
jgi:hypothetical protein